MTSARRRGLFFNVLPAIVYTVLVFIGGSLPRQPVPDIQFVPADKFLHFVAFGGLQILLLRAVRWERPRSSLNGQLTLATLMASALGALLEFWQAALPHRSADVWDWVADTLGALFVGMLLWVALPRRSARTS